MGLNINLTQPQSDFFHSTYKFVAFVGGFGSGKSHALFAKMLEMKMKAPKVDIGYFAPTYSLIRDIAHVRLQNMLDEAGLAYKLNKSDNVLEIKGYGKILFRTLDNPDRIVGFEIFAAFIDELDTLSHDNAENAWNKIIARVRQVNPADVDATNQIFVATTPEGYRFVYHRWGKNPKPSYKLVKAPTSSNPHLPKDYIQALRDTYPENLIEAYLNGEFVNLASKTVYPNFDRAINHTDRCLQPNDTLHIGMDFNVRNMNAVTHVLDKAAVQAYAIDEITDLIDTPSMIKEIKNRYAGHTIYIYPDSSGTSGRTIDASKSDLKLLRDAGFFVRAKSKNPRIKNRVQSMNFMFGNPGLDPHYYVNTDKCPEYTHGLEQQTYDDNGKPIKNPANNVDDITEAGGYCIYYVFPIDKPNSQTATVRSY